MLRIETAVTNEQVRVDGVAWQYSGLSKAKGDHTDALRSSILTLWFEATGCYNSGLFEACILSCGAIVERCLKLEYELAVGSLPRGRWTLARCAYELDWDGVLSKEVVDLAKKLVSPHNSRAHALLEHTDPHLASLGDLPAQAADPEAQGSLIEAYRSEAKEVLDTTFRIVQILHGSPAV
jgi:hypothetical protein